jgi:hypothetical protein
VHRKRQGGEGLGKAVAVKVAEGQNMARHVLRNALVLWLSGRHSGRATRTSRRRQHEAEMANPASVGIQYWSDCTVYRGIPIRLVERVDIVTQRAATLFKRTAQKSEEIHYRIISLLILFYHARTEKRMRQWRQARLPCTQR